MVVEHCLQIRWVQRLILIFKLSVVIIKYGIFISSVMVAAENLCLSESTIDQEHMQQNVNEPYNNSVWLLEYFLQTYPRLAKSIIAACLYCI